MIIGYDVWADRELTAESAARRQMEMRKLARIRWIIILSCLFSALSACSVVNALT
jgi:hypothetical protein